MGKFHFNKNAFEKQFGKSVLKNCFATFQCVKNVL